MNTIELIYSFNENNDNALWELWDCGYQTVRDGDGTEYELRLNWDLFLNGELIPYKEVKEKLDYIFRRTEEE